MIVVPLAQYMIHCSFDLKIILIILHEFLNLYRLIKDKIHSHILILKKNSKKMFLESTV